MAKGLYIAVDYKPNVGGIAEHTHQMVRHLTELGEDVTVLTPSLPGDAEFDQACGYPVKRFNCGFVKHGVLKYAMDRRLILFGILRAIRRLKPDYLVCDRWSPIAGLNVTAASRITGVPYLFFGHGLELQYPTRFNSFRRWTLKGAARVVCVSGYTRSLAEGLGVRPDRLEVVPNGYDPRLVAAHHEARTTMDFPLLDSAFTPESPTILTISRLTKRKGIDRVIEAMPLVLSEVPDARYVIAGDGGDRSRIESLIVNSPARDSIIYMGPISEDDKMECYKRCDVFVMPSRQEEGGDVEGFGIVFLEANAFGKPVIGGRSGGVPDAIVDGKTGILVEPNNVGEIAHSLVLLLRDQSLAKRMGETGRQRVKDDLNWHANAERLLRVIHDTLATIR